MCRFPMVEYHQGADDFGHSADDGSLKVDQRLWRR